MWFFMIMRFQSVDFFFCLFCLLCPLQVMDHKTVRKYGLAQIYLEPEEYGWFTRWLRLRKRAVPLNSYFFSSLGRGEAKDMVRYFRKAWTEMGLPGAPSLLDVRSAVATYVSITNT